MLWTGLGSIHEVQNYPLYLTNSTSGSETKKRWEYWKKAKKKKKKGILGVEENGDISGQKTRNQRKWEDGKLALLQ